MTLAEISSLLDAGELTALKHIRSTLRALDDLEGTPWSNLIAACDDDHALAEARTRSEEISAGRRRGPLDGVAVVVKDNIDVAGLPTRAGSTVFDDASPAESDADIVMRLRAAGAIIVGKAHLHELAYGSAGDVSASGPARHPRSPARITGGSSSGSAALVALGAVPLAIGTDTGCSVRAPAALTGITGLMPSLGLLPTTGVLPVSPTFDHVGLFAADASDARLAWSALHRGTRSAPSAACRVAVPLNPILAARDADAAAAVERTLASMRTLGHSVIPVEIPGIEELADQYPVIVGFEMHARYRNALRTRPEAFQPATRKRLRTAAAYGPRDYEESLRRVEELRPRISIRSPRRESMCSPSRRPRSPHPRSGRPR